MFRLLIVLFALVAAHPTSAQRPLTTPDFGGFRGSGFNSAQISSFVPLPDGGYLVLGKFTVWYDGKEFRDVLRLRPDYLPDTDWQILANNGISGAVVLQDSVVLYGPIDLINGVATRSITHRSLVGAGPLPFDRIPGAITTLPGGYDAATGWIYVSSAMATLNYQVNRVNAKTGAVDPTWRFVLPTNINGEPAPPIVDGQGGLWITWVDDCCGNGFIATTMTRFSVAEPGRELIPRLFGGFQRRPLFADGFVYLGERRYRISDGALDTTWKTYSTYDATIDRGYYYASVLTSTTTAVFYTLRRAPLSGTGAFDNWPFDQPDPRFIVSDYFAHIVPYGPVAAPTAVGVFMFTPGSGGALTLVVKEDAITNPEVTVVEYYATALKRYFITGRKAEQDALDALPAAFVRTGMRFAAKSGRYRDIPERPVCRLYAAPDRGGSNSHFYGIGDDCQTLNKQSGLKYEGFDFAVDKPQFIATLIAVCPQQAPQMVWRLFNNKSATNEGNHRYVVSQLAREKMQAQGWIDEGPVFCVTSVVDAVLAH